MYTHVPICRVLLIFLKSKFNTYYSFGNKLPPVIYIYIYMYTIFSYSYCLLPNYCLFENINHHQYEQKLISFSYELSVVTTT